MKWAALLTAFIWNAGSVALAEPPVKIIANGVELHYTEMGESDPIVCVHGTLQDYREFDVFSRELALWGYRVIAYSRRYNVPNDNPNPAPDYSATTDAQDLAALLDALGLEQVNLVGHSHGALAALLFTLEHPERVRSLVLAEPLLVPWLPTIEGGQGMYESLFNDVIAPSAKVYSNGFTEDSLRLAWNFLMRPGAYDRLVDVVKMRLRANAREWGALVASTAPFPDVDKNAVAKLDTPILLLRGELTRPMMELIDAELRRLLPRAQHFVVENASHDSLNEMPLETTAAIRDFLDSTY